MKKGKIFRVFTNVTIFMKVFPSLLKQLLDKDFGDAIRAGFECTGICPLNAERVLSKLPKEQREVDSQVQQQLLNKLSSIRYSPGPSSKAPRPKKKDRLPAGASYTCTPEGAVVGLPDDEDEDLLDSPSVVLPTPKRARKLQFAGDASHIEESPTQESSSEKEESSSDEDKSSSDSEEVSSSEELGVGIRAIINRRNKKKEDRKKEDEERLKRAEEMEETDKQEYQYLPGSYVVVMYDGEWYLAQVLDKEVEQEAECEDNYVYLNFMKKNHTGESFQWPSTPDRLNMLKEDILFTCDPPAPSAGTSSSRRPTFTLSKMELKKAKWMHMLKKVNYLTITVYQYRSHTVPVSNLKSVFLCCGQLGYWYSIR
jgi:hypothetical protein